MNSISKIFTLIFFSFFITHNTTQAQETDSLLIHFLKNSFHKGDSIQFEVSSMDSINARKASTLHLWIEEIKTGKKWHYRYPYINGYLSAALKINENMSEGDYAFNFSVQKAFFSLNGKVMNTNKHYPFLNYALISKTNQTIIVY